MLFRSYYFGNNALNHNRSLKKLNGSLGPNAIGYYPYKGYSNDLSSLQNQPLQVWNGKYTPAFDGTAQNQSISFPNMGFGRDPDQRYNSNNDSNNAINAQRNPSSTNKQKRKYVTMYKKFVKELKNYIFKQFDNLKKKGVNNKYIRKIKEKINKIIISLTVVGATYYLSKYNTLSFGFSKKSKSLKKGKNPIIELLKRLKELIIKSLNKIKKKFSVNTNKPKKELLNRIDSALSSIKSFFKIKKSKRSKKKSKKKK